MAFTRNIGFQLTFPENLKKDANIPATERLAFDDLGDFIVERDKVKRALEKKNSATLKVDYSDFANHVFFDSAQQKADIATNRILNKYPFNGNLEEKDAFHLTGSGYENYFFEQWPREVAYVEFNGTDQYISASDSDTKLRPGSSSIYISAWIKPVVSNQNIILQYISASTSPTLTKQGYELYLSGAVIPHLKFSLYSGSQKTTISASYSNFTSSFNNVAVLYDVNNSLLSLFINKNKVGSSSVSYGPIDTNNLTNLFVGSGSQFTASSSSFSFYSGSMDEVRILNSGSDLFHFKNYNKPIDTENYVKLYYKFNEGITETGSIDSFVVDYSNSELHGKFLNYTSSGRVSGSMMLTDPGDPILYSFHSRVINFTSSIQLSASLYDLQNNNQIFNLIPEGVLLEDERADSLLASFSLALARFFDEQKLYIDQFVNLKITNYEDVDETPDEFLSSLQGYFGWKVSEHFNSANPLEYLFGENVLASGSLQTPLVEIRNQFWRRILNNLPLLLKSKGTRKNVDYLLNSLGLNKENIILKEYGFLPGTSIQDERVSKQKVQARLGFTSSFTTGSFLKTTTPIITSGPTGEFTVESMVQLPFPSASYTGSLVTGSIWQFHNDVSASFMLYYVRDSLTSETGKFVLSSSEGSIFSSSVLSVFDGDFTHIAAGKNVSTGFPFISVRQLDNQDLSISSDITGSSAFSIYSSNYDLIVGANSGSLYNLKTQGFFGEIRYWNTRLSSSEIDDHAYNFQSVGIRNPYLETSPLRGHWSLNENLITNSGGVLSGVVDLSRNGNNLIGWQFPANYNPYDKFLHDYNFLSPSVDLKWTDNKIRIRNKSELSFNDISNDTNEVSLEFNLIEALNEDIVKIFSTLDILNNLIGSPIYKYRDEYSDLEGVRRKYFERLSDSLNFSSFFSLFTWFDRKISDSIKQILPARVKFIGGEQVIESHLLERPRYKFQYPVFRTPQEVPEAIISLPSSLDDSKIINQFEGDILQRNFEKSPITRITTSERSSYVDVTAHVQEKFISSFRSGDEILKNKNLFFPIKISGDTQNDVNNSNSGVNFRNDYARKILKNRDRDNE